MPAPSGVTGLRTIYFILLLSLNPYHIFHFHLLTSILLSIYGADHAPPPCSEMERAFHRVGRCSSRRRRTAIRWPDSSQYGNLCCGRSHTPKAPFYAFPVLPSFPPTTLPPACSSISSSPFLLTRPNLSAAAAAISLKIRSSKDTCAIEDYGNNREPSRHEPRTGRRAVEDAVGVPRRAANPRLRQNGTCIKEVI